jgi:hypothetical protein
MSFCPVAGPRGPGTGGTGLDHRLRREPSVRPAVRPARPVGESAESGSDPANAVPTTVVDLGVDRGRQSWLRDRQTWPAGLWWTCMDRDILLKTGRQRVGGVRIGRCPRPGLVPACLRPRPAPAMRCRTELYLDQGGACGAAGPAPAPPSGLGGPGRRAPGHTHSAAEI